MVLRVVVMLLAIAGAFSPDFAQGQEIFRDKKQIRNNFVKTVTSWACCPSFCDKPGEARKKVRRKFDKKGNELKREYFYTSLEPQMIHFFEYRIKSGYLNIKSPLQTKYIYDPQNEDTTARIKYYYEDKKLHRKVRYESPSDSLVTLYFYKDGLKNQVIRFNGKGMPEDKTEIVYNDQEQPVKKRKHHFVQGKQDTLTGYYASRDKMQKLSPVNWELNETSRIKYNNKGLVSEKSTNLPDGSSFSKEQYTYTMHKERDIVSKLHYFRQSGEQEKECTHYYQYKFYEHY